MLEARHRQGVVVRYSIQAHLGAARQTLHLHD